VEIYNLQHDTTHVTTNRSTLLLSSYNKQMINAPGLNPGIIKLDQGPIGLADYS